MSDSTESVAIADPEPAGSSAPSIATEQELEGGIIREPAGADDTPPAAEGDARDELPPDHPANIVRRAMVFIREQMTHRSIGYDRGIDLALGRIEHVVGLPVRTLPLAQLHAMGHTFEE